MTELQAMKSAVSSFGEMFSGGDEESLNRVAQEWIDEGFSNDGASEWMSAGFWDAAVASEIYDAGISLRLVKKTAASLAECDMDPVYAMCNGDYSVKQFIAACNQ